MLRFDERTVSRHEDGWVVLYRNDAAYKGTDVFLGPGGKPANSPQEALRYSLEADAHTALGLQPEMGRGYMPGVVCKLYQHTLVRYELGGESMSDLKDLLKKIQLQRPKTLVDGRYNITPMPAVGIQVSGQDAVPGRVETFPKKERP